jgi:hypothetical protein
MMEDARRVPSEPDDGLAILVANAKRKPGSPVIAFRSKRRRSGYDN